MDKTFEPQSIEQQCYKSWEEAGLFKASGSGDPYCILLPPPNVTGSLHMGHGFQQTIMDALTRYHRMKGDNTLWQVGTDHAGIATQMVVERQLNAQGKTRHDLGREDFIKKVWEWKEHSGGTITGQMRRLGTSPDWSREVFTMDEDLSKAVTEVFVKLHEEGLIYRGKRLVNWDPVLHTAVSDLEVLNEEEDGHMWHMRYPLADGSGELVVATTRPETMLGDTAVAVHPDDERYQGFIGKEIKLPITGRLIPVIADDYVDQEFGTGCVKITPAHDFNDYDMGKRHNLPMINILTDDAKINDDAPEAYRGLDRFDARKQIVADLDAQGSLVKIEPHKLKVPRGDRTGAVIEPYLTEQWFADAKKLSIKAKKIVKNKKTSFFPKNWSKTYFQWMNNIEPWCISRQLWWGHQIPAWYGPDKKIFVANNLNEAKKLAKKKYKKDVELVRDEDVLDTWFSSGLWAFATLGWPKKNEYLKKFYPTSVLVTGFDIIFFWVARMMMFGMEFLNKEPFKDIYVHALVRDEKGQKMSKSKGNVIDPLVLIEKYSADALRFTLLSMASPGRDVKLSEDRVKGYRNFLNKLWNANNFLSMNKCDFKKSKKSPKIKLNINKWIISELNQTTKEIEKNIKDYRFDEAARNIYQFVWHSYCDWYLELSKTILNSKDKKSINEVKLTTSYVFKEILVLLHPFIPFITEELWLKNKLDKLNSSYLMHTNWTLNKIKSDKNIKEVQKIIDLISQLRSFKNELNVSPGSFVDMSLANLPKKDQDFIIKNEIVLKRLGRINNFFDSEKNKPSANLVIAGDIFKIYFDQSVDLSLIKENLLKRQSKYEAELDVISKRLSNKSFVDRAPKNIVDQEKNNYNELQKNIDKISITVKGL